MSAAPLGVFARRLRLHQHARGHVGVGSEDAALGLRLGRNRARRTSIATHGRRATPSAHASASAAVAAATVAAAEVAAAAESTSKTVCTEGPKRVLGWEFVVKSE